jgi:hypothetical protein
MPPPDPRDFTFIPVRDLIDLRHPVPDKPGVYGFFLHGGTRLLELTSWFELDGRRPLTIRDHQLLYAGGALRLGERLKQHMRIGHLENSSLRKTLLAIEYARHAVSRSGTPACKVRGQISLTAWLRENAIVGIQFTRKPFVLERQILEAHACPFNVALRRETAYAKVLTRWKAETFPKDNPEVAHRMRKL